MITLSTPDLFQLFRKEMHKIADFRYASAVLQWDQETYLPPKGAAMRGQQVATLSETAHEAFVSPKLGELLTAVLDRPDLTLSERRNAELVKEDYIKQQKLPSAFVRKISETTQRSFHSWIAARKQDDFGVFAADLSVLVDLKRQEADMLGYAVHPYDALLNDHDKGSDTSLLDALFSDVRQPLKELLDTIVSKPEVNDNFLRQHFPKQQQWDFGMHLLRDLGYDLEAGRQDLAEHPFTINFNSKDVRITTRIDEQDLSNMVWSCIHEVGHALYEQGLPETEYGMPLGEAASYSIHESQSRLWENHVGRSLDFCEHYWPLLQQYFPEQLKAVTAEDFYRAINKVQPSLIRTDADELTYHFHVMVRYEIEKKLIENSIQTSDIPAYWNDHYKTYLGVDVPDDKRGCLQDIHWSHGSFGYFPTYSQGSFYAAQFYSKASTEIPELSKVIGNGQNQPLLSWLRQKVHQHGRMYKSEDLCRLITGDGLKIQYFLDHLLAKYSKIYHF